MRVKISHERVRSEFVQKVEELSGQNILACYQCGECSAGCPLIEYMDLLPNQVIRYVQLGIEDVLKCNTIWLCASCLTCSVRCPKNVDLARVMEALRLLITRKNVAHIDIKSKNIVDKYPPIALVSAFRKYS